MNNYLRFTTSIETYRHMKTYCVAEAYQEPSRRPTMELLAVSSRSLFSQKISIPDIKKFLCQKPTEHGKI